MFILALLLRLNKQNSICFAGRLQNHLQEHHITYDVNVYAIKTTLLLKKILFYVIIYLYKIAEKEWLRNKRRLILLTIIFKYIFATGIQLKRIS